MYYLFIHVYVCACVHACVCVCEYVCAKVWLAVLVYVVYHGLSMCMREPLAFNCGFTPKSPSWLGHAEKGSSTHCLIGIISGICLRNYRLGQRDYC